MADNLYCPRCAKPFSSETSYCRTCGLDLSGVGEIVRGDAVNAPVTTRRPNPGLIRLAIGLFFCATLLGVINAVLADLHLYPEIYGKLLFAAGLTAAMITFGSAFVFPAKVYAKRRSTADAADTADPVDTARHTRHLSPVGPNMNGIDFPTNACEPQMVDRTSVTEHTTRNLE